MKVLLMARPGSLSPWGEDFQAALGADHEVAVWVPQLPFPEQVAGAVAVADLGAALTPDMIDAAAAAGVRLWQIIGAGFDHLDLERFRAGGIAVANTPGAFSAPALAEHALLLMLSVARRVPLTRRHLAEQTAGRAFGEELHGKTLGLVGLGASGTELGRIARALGMEVLAVARRPELPPAAAAAGIERLGGLDALDAMLARADYVSIHVPLTADTANLFDAGRFAAMKPTAALINVARGGVVDQAALADALRSGAIRAAGLDVFAVEPIDPDDPLLAMDAVVATPHVAGCTHETSVRRGQAAAENVARVAAGLAPRNVVGGATIETDQQEQA